MIKIIYGEEIRTNSSGVRYNDFTLVDGTLKTIRDDSIHSLKHAPTEAVFAIIVKDTGTVRATCVMNDRADCNVVRDAFFKWIRFKAVTDEAIAKFVESEL